MSDGTHLRKRRAAAFTLVELLVVVSIIALLLAVLIPGLRAARNQAKVTVCMSNLRELGRCTLLYNSDYHDQMPRSLHSAGLGFRYGLPWGYAFFGYVTRTPWTPAVPPTSWLAVLNGSYRCPFDARSPNANAAPAWSYGYNVYFELAETETDGSTWRVATQVRRPGATVVFGEIADDKAMAGLPTADHLMAHFWSRYAAPPEVDGDRHRPRSAYAFADGHAENLSFAHTFDAAEGVDDWNPSTAR